MRTDKCFINCRTVYIVIYCMCILGLVIYNCLSNGDVITRLFFSDRYNTAMDFFNCVASASAGVTEIFEAMDGVTYPAAAVVIFKLIQYSLPDYIVYQDDHFVDGFVLRTSQYALVVFIVLIIFVSMCTVYLVCKSLDNNILFDEKFIFASCCTFSYGFLFGIERGNIIIAVPFLVLFFLVFKDSNNIVLKEIALLVLALAAGLKIYPAFFGLFLLKKGKWYEAIRTMLYGIFFMTGPIILFGGITAVKKWIDNLLSFNAISGAEFDLAGCGAVQISRTFCYLFSVDRDIADKIYQFVGGAQYIICIILIMCFFLSKKNWEKMLSIVFIMLMFPRWSNDYCYMYFMIPFVFFVKMNFQNLIEIVYYVCFVLILTPYILPKLIIFEHQLYGFEFTNFVRQMTVFVFMIVFIVHSLYRGIVSTQSWVPHK